MAAANAPQRRAEFRFYEELNDFLPAERRKRAFVHAFNGTPSCGSSSRITITDRGPDRRLLPWMRANSVRC